MSTEEILGQQGITVDAGARFPDPRLSRTGILEWSDNTPPEVIERDNQHRRALGLPLATVSQQPADKK